jgi:hypothetical protein
VPYQHHYLVSEAAALLEARPDQLPADTLPLIPGQNGYRGQGKRPETGMLRFYDYRAEGNMPDDFAVPQGDERYGQGAALSELFNELGFIFLTEGLLIDLAY